MIKVLIIIDKWLFGGREKVIENIIYNINHRKFKIDILVIKNLKEKEKLIEKEFPNNTNVFFVEYKKRSELVFYLVKFFKQQKYDIILTTIFPPAVFLIYLSKIISFSSFKIIISVHGFFKTKHFYSYFLTKWLFKKVSLVITVSGDLKSYLKTKFQVPSEKLMTIYNPLICFRGKKDKEGIPFEYKKLNNFKKIITVARLDLKSKDFNTLFEALKLVKSKIKDIKLIIIGDGPDGDEIKKNAQEKKVISDIIFLGKRKDVLKYIKYADVFVLASFSEGLPSVILESFFCGCPVVATDCPTGPRELLDKNKNGLLVPMKEPPKMAEAILKILTDKKLKEKLVKNSKEFLDNFDIKKQTEKYEKVFMRVLKK